MRTAADLVRAARLAGARVEQVERVPMPGYPWQSTIAARISFDDPWAAARLLKLLADQDAADPYVRAWALAILRECFDSGECDDRGPGLSPQANNAFVRAVHRNVQAQVRFIREPRETFQSARVTMAALAGDCDDHARLVHALARAGGAYSRLAFLEQDGQPVHVVSLLRDLTVDGAPRYRWAETTIGAAYGEDPRFAYRRLHPRSGARDDLR